MSAALSVAAEHDLAGRHECTRALPPKDKEKWIVSQFIRSRVALGARAENQA